LYGQELVAEFGYFLIHALMEIANLYTLYSVRIGRNQWQKYTTLHGHLSVQQQLSFSFITYM